MGRATHVRLNAAEYYGTFPQAPDGLLGSLIENERKAVIR